VATSWPSRSSPSSRRAQDLQDALALIEHSNTEDLQVAREAVELITRRGYERGKDLRADLGRVLAMCPDAG
jgi:hypothetical protein